MTGLLIFVFASLLTIPVLISKLSNADTFWSGMALSQKSNHTDSGISSDYAMLNGHGYQKIFLRQGKYLFDVKIKAEKGSIDVNLTNDKEGKNIFSRLEQSREITVDQDRTLYLQISANAHKGGYAIKWHGVRQ